MFRTALGNKSNCKINLLTITVENMSKKHKTCNKRFKHANATKNIILLLCKIWRLTAHMEDTWWTKRYRSIWCIMSYFTYFMTRIEGTFLDDFLKSVIGEGFFLSAIGIFLPCFLAFLWINCLRMLLNYTMFSRIWWRCRSSSSRNRLMWSLF